jgi:hypothetical protein
MALRCLRATGLQVRAAKLLASAQVVVYDDLGASQVSGHWRSWILGLGYALQGLVQLGTQIEQAIQPPPFLPFGTNWLCVCVCVRVCVCV